MLDPTVNVLRPDFEICLRSRLVPTWYHLPTVEVAVAREDADTIAGLIIRTC